MVDSVRTQRDAPVRGGISGVPWGLAGTNTAEVAAPHSSRWPRGHVRGTAGSADVRLAISCVRTPRDAPGRGGILRGTDDTSCTPGRCGGGARTRRGGRRERGAPGRGGILDRARVVKPCRPGAHGPEGARPGNGASVHGQASNGAWSNQDTWPRADGQVVGGRTGAGRPLTRSRNMWPS